MSDKAGFFERAKQRMQIGVYRSQNGARRGVIPIRTPFYELYTLICMGSPREALNCSDTVTLTLKRVSVEIRPRIPQMGINGSEGEVRVFTLVEDTRFQFGFKRVV